MKKIKNISFALTLSIFGFTSGLKAQNPDAVFSKVSAAIQGGNADALSSLFNASVEVTVPGADQAYSLKQATQILKDYFSKYPPKGFSVKHKGNSGTTHYCTGSYASAKGGFDTNVFLQNINGQFLITQIRFEEE